MAGETIWFAHEKSKVSEVQGAINPSSEPKAPFFNLVDDSDLTQEELIGTIAKYFEIEYGAMNTVASAWAKVSCRHMNVHH